MPHVGSGGSNIGLTQPLEGYFNGTFESRRKNEGKVCPGEEICAITGPLRDKSRSIEVICQGCSLRHSKPGSIPTHIAALVIQAYRMETLFEAGAGSPYPEVFSPLEWEAFLILKQCRGKDEEKRLAKPAGQSQQSEEMRLRQRLAKG